MTVKIPEKQAYKMLGLRMTVGELSKQSLNANLEKRVVEEWKRAGYVEESKDHG